MGLVPWPAPVPDPGASNSVIAVGIKHKAVERAVRVDVVSLDLAFLAVTVSNRSPPGACPSIRLVRFRCSTSGMVMSAGSGLPLSVVILQPLHFAGH